MEYLPDVYQHLERAFPHVHSAHQELAKACYEGGPLDKRAARRASRPRLEIPTRCRRSRTPRDLFPADELIIVTRPGSEADWVEEDRTRETLERLGLPVTHLAIDRP
jgi:hypothetical protein